MSEDLSEEPASRSSSWTLPVAGPPGRLTVAARVAALILGLFGVAFVGVGGLLVFTELNPSAANPGIVVTEFGQGVRSVFVAVGLLVALLALVEIAAAVGAWMGQAWGRVPGILYAVVFGVGSLVILLTSLGREPAAAGTALIVGWFVAYAYVAVALIAKWRGPLIP
ncbi:MAG: hypothetical protein ABJB65_07005 [Chloroflexota bacterium]